MDVPDEIIGERILLRKHSVSDARSIQEAIVESKAEIDPFFDWAANLISLEERQMKLAREAAAWVLREQLTYGVWLGTSERYIGDLGFYRPDWRLRRFEIGYWLRSTEVGHGYVTEGARLLCDLAFELFEARKVFVQCDGDNARSAQVAIRLGFREEGRLRNHSQKPNGDPVDTLIYGILREEWLARRGRTP